MMESFKIRTYGRMELAQLYCPHLAPVSAYRKLRMWIEHYPHLTEQLQASGKLPSTRTYTPQQVRLIVEALGEP